MCVGVCVRLFTTHTKPSYPLSTIWICTIFKAVHHLGVSTAVAFSILYDTNYHTPPRSTQNMWKKTYLRASKVCRQIFEYRWWLLLLLSRTAQHNKCQFDNNFYLAPYLQCFLNQTIIRFYGPGRNLHARKKNWSDSLINHKNRNNLVGCRNWNDVVNIAQHTSLLKNYKHI